MENIRQRYIEIQNQIAQKVSQKNIFQKAELKTIAGVDLAYWTENGIEKAVCCIVVLDIATHEILEKEYSSGVIECEYMSGFLAFRELPLVLKTAEKLEISPDIFMFDGNGILHDRKAGIATHASFSLNKPCIGVAKTYFSVRHTEYHMPDNQAGSFTDIVIDGEIYGRALRTVSDVKPVFVSVGNYIDIDTATQLTMELVDRKESHIPLPTRLADLETHIMRDKLKKYSDDINI